MNVYKLNRKCKKCNKRIIDGSKSGYCNKHRDRTGRNNSFYGRIHSIETINIIKKKTSIASKKLWKDSEYRDKVIANISKPKEKTKNLWKMLTYREKVIKGISKPRREGFKKEQSERITQWYKNNPEQKILRSVKMKQYWKNGTIVKNGYSCNSSKLEKELFNDILKIAPFAQRKQTIRDANNRWLFPDILIEYWGTIIEFYGDYWHANPEIYKPDDIIHNDITAKQIWKKDEERIRRLQNIPDNNSNFIKEYNIIIVWEKDYKNNKKQILQEINQRLNYEYSY